MTGRTARRGVESGGSSGRSTSGFMEALNTLYSWNGSIQKLREMYRANPEDPFLETWKRRFKGDFTPYEHFSDQYLELSMARLVTELFKGKEIDPLDYDQRLMGADEAAEILGFDQIPDSPGDVIQYYRRLLKDGHPELHRAKDTLLLRIYGSSSVSE
ncbi:MAG: hypothetical protein R3B69_01170 [Candidatus Paceibacterota bacterium]